MKIAIVGAGAAGCFAAANLSLSPEDEVVLFEKQHKPMQKVKASGGGRCNVTHALFEIPALVKKYPRGAVLLKKTLHHFSPKDTIAWFESKGVPLKSEADGRMFPITDDAQTIIDCIWKAMHQNKALIKYNHTLEAIACKEGKWHLSFKNEQVYIADKVLLTTGGFPKDEQWQWLRNLGLDVVAPVPSLFTINLPKHPITKLMGLSVANAQVKLLGTKICEQGPVLITHWGLSGPAVLRTSAWGARELGNLNYACSVQINWLGDINEHECRSIFQDMRMLQGKLLVQNKIPFDLPKRLWHFLLEQAGILSEVRWADIKSEPLNKFIQCLCAYKVAMQGKTTFKEEFVTAGGIAINEINAATMELKKLPNLYVAGEIIDVDGITGGFNFQHAWSSSFIAAKAIASI